MATYAKVYLENGAVHTLGFPVKDETEAREVTLSSLESITGKHRDTLVRIVSVEMIEIEEDKAKR